MMLRYLSAVVSAVLIYTSGSAQVQQKYDSLVTEADRLYEHKSFPASAWTYKEAFGQPGASVKPEDRYNAACSYALSGNTDTAFYHLFLLANGTGIDIHDHITEDTDLASLKGDKRWDELLAIVKANHEKSGANVNRELKRTLEDIYFKDQAGRQELKSVARKYGRDSPEMKEQWRKINVQDSLNQVAVTAILDEHGWLGADVVGRTGNQALFLVIQHADLFTQEKYLPMMRIAVKEGRANSSSLALLEDRVLLRQGKRQIYGSQIFFDGETGVPFVQPLDDPDHVDERRAAVGLEPLSKYLSNWDLKWDVEAYKKQLPEIEERMRKLNER